MEIARQDDAGDAIDQEGDQDGGKRQLDVGDAHDQRIDGPADIAADQPEGHAEDEGEDDRAEADEDRDPRTIENGRQHVATLCVGPERVGPFAAFDPGRGQRGVEQVESAQVERVVRRQPRRADRTEDRDRGKDRRDDGHRRAPEAVHDVAVPGAMQRAAANRNRSIGHRSVGHALSDNSSIHWLQQSPAVSCSMPSDSMRLG